VLERKQERRQEEPVADIDRRDVFTMFSALAVLAAGDVFAQSTSQGRLTSAELSRSRVVRFKDLPVGTLDNGGEQRRVMSGMLPTGEFIEIHETVLPAGKVPHAPHKHPNSEWLFIQTGTLEYDNDGTIVPLGPGDIVFSASNVMHGLRNVGATSASYIVFSVSKQSV
jgi:mannose-6-phosphate isomerase-like protein (cupin superfamily)